MSELRSNRLPEQFVQNMIEMLGEKEFARYVESFNAPRLFGLRVNESKISVEEFLKLAPWELKPIPWIANGFYYEKEVNPAKHPYYFAGLYYLQEPSAMTPADVLTVHPGERVLDLCAAPGGKSTALGAKLRGKGLLVSNDVSASRAKALLKNVEVFGIPKVLVTCETPEKLLTHFREYFDKILVDAPCSGEGMFRKEGKLMTAWESQGPDFFAPIQKDILDAAADMLRPGGALLYSTCTFSRKEDEDNIRDFLAAHSDFSLERIKDYDGFVRAYGMEEAIRLYPHRLDGEGHFVALLTKKGEHIAPSEDLNFIRGKISPETEDFFRECTYSFAGTSLALQKEMLYAVPNEVSALKGMRFLRTGLLIGEMKKNRFEPSQALAMAMKKEDYSTTLDLPACDVRIIKYLKGETIEYNEGEITGPAKDVLICVDSYPLGWAKINNGTLKNRYLPGWRWL